MPFLKSEKFNYIGIYIGLTILICAIILKFADEDTYKYFILPQIFVCISSIFIFIWWRSRLKATYIKAVYNRELEILKTNWQHLRVTMKFYLLFYIKIISLFPLSNLLSEILSAQIIHLHRIKIKYLHNLISYLWSEKALLTIARLLILLFPQQDIWLLMHFLTI